MVFTVSCPECNSEFPVDSAKVPDEGVYAQCSVCPGTFLVEKPVEGALATGELETWSHEVDSDADPDQPPGLGDAWTEEAADEGKRAGVVEVSASGARPGEAAESPAEEPTAAPAAVAETPSFGQSDPDARAARLARVLVSDMMTYNPALYEKATEKGTLAEDFEDEVKRSWSEYLEQVGEELARSTPHFTRALNDILAKGEEVFDESMYE